MSGNPATSTVTDSSTTFWYNPRTAEYHCGTSGPSTQSPMLTIATGRGFHDITATSGFNNSIAPMFPKKADLCADFYHYYTALADINSDGLVDLILSHPPDPGDTTHRDPGQLLINTGARWQDLNGLGAWTRSAGPNPFPAVPTDSPDIQMSNGAYLAMGRAFVDLNGDGLPDLVQTGQYLTKAWLNTFRPPVIWKFPNGLATKSTIDYETITTKAAKDSGLYADDEPLLPGTSLMAAPLRVVESIVAEDRSGAGTTFTTYYRYHSLRRSSFGRGPLGFRRVAVTDGSTKIRTNTTYAQGYPTRDCRRWSRGISCTPKHSKRTA